MARSNSKHTQELSFHECSKGEVWEKKHDDNGPNESSNDDKSDDDTALPLESLKVLSTYDRAGNPKKPIMNKTRQGGLPG